eukprot:m.47452 g.47452  ORF g.47452 m.47452 type:complete len:833 (-) comp10766_c0_seq4:70-2568(-)
MYQQGAYLLVVLVLWCSSSAVFAQDLPYGGGAALTNPTSRSNIKGLAHLWNGRYDAGGPATVKANSATGIWPSPETSASSVRYGLCGTKSGDDLDFTTPEGIVAEYEPGTSVTFTFKTDASQPQGHVEFKVCRVASEINQGCFNANTLSRNSGQETSTPYDPAYPGRFFIPPGAGTHTMTYLIPSTLVCTNCVLQWHFVAANECNPPGYSSFSSADVSYGFDTNRPACVDTFPIEFWGCSDIAILPPTLPSQSCNSAGDSGCKVSMGYYQSWARHRASPFDYPAEKINARLYTHLVYAFAHIDSSYHVSPLESDDIVAGTGGYAAFNQHVRAENPAIKTLLSIGGYNFNSDPDTKERFSLLVEDSVLRANFIEGLILFLRQHDFDGVDLDWEFPAVESRGGIAADKANFGTLVKEMRDAFDAETSDPDARLLITVAVAPSRYIADVAYDITKISNNADFVNLLSYNYHGPWHSTTGPHTPLWTSDGENIQETVAYWIINGTPRRKLLVGLAAYATGWTLLFEELNGIGAEASGPSRRAPYTLEDGNAAYFEVAQYVRNGYVEVKDNTTVSAYAYFNNQWYSYDNANTIREKVEYVMDMNLGGAFIWSVDQDDFRRNDPLATTMNSELGVPEPPPSANDSKMPLSTTIIIVICIAAVFIIFVLYVVAKCSCCNGDGGNSDRFGTATYDDNGVGKEYDTPIPILDTRIQDIGHDEFELDHDDRMKGRFYDDDDEDQKYLALKRKLDGLSRASSTDEIGVQLDSEGRMIARQYDSREIEDNELVRRTNNPARELEVARNDEGRFVARHYDDIEKPVVFGNQRTKSVSLSRRLINE